MESKDYEKWMNLSLEVCKGNKYVAEEVLHTVLEQILTKDYDIESIENYMFISLKNRYINHVKSDSKHKDFPMSLDIEDESTYLECDEDIKIDASRRVLHKLNEGDKEIFTLHITRGYSQRKISREKSIKLYYVLTRVRYIKQLILEEYERAKETNSKN